MDAERARKIESKVLRRLSDHGGAHLAAATGLSEATVSRLKTEHLVSFSKLLTALGFKIVDQDLKCYKPHVALAWRSLARESFDHVDGEETE